MQKDAPPPRPRRVARRHAWTRPQLLARRRATPHYMAAAGTGCSLFSLCQVPVRIPPSRLLIDHGVAHNGVQRGSGSRLWCHVRLLRAPPFHSCEGEEQLLGDAWHTGAAGWESGNGFEMGRERAWIDELEFHHTRFSCAFPTRQEDPGNSVQTRETGQTAVSGGKSPRMCPRAPLLLQTPATI